MFAALRSMQQQQANSSQQSSLNVRAGHVSGRSGLQETGAISDRESVATTIFSSQSKAKRDRDTYVVDSLKDRQKIFKKSLNGKLTRPSEER